NRGIGLALTRELLSQGHHIVAAARHSADEFDALEKQHAELFHRVELDVNDSDSIAAAADAVAKKISALDVLVNNAAIFPEEGDESILDIDLQHFRDTFETNVLGVIRVTRAFLPLLRKSKTPRVVNISSGAGSISQKDDSSY